MTQKRQPKGVPVGGQFAQNGHDEAGYTLTSEVEDARDLARSDANDRSSIRPRTQEETGFSDEDYEGYIESYREALSDRYATDARDTEEIIDEYVASGLLKETYRRSDDAPREFTTGDIYVGRTDDGSRMFAQYTAQFPVSGRSYGAAEDPEVRVSPVRFSMSGMTIRKHSRFFDGGGQNDYQLLKVAGDKGYALDAEDARELHALWNKNHMNDMNAGTLAQKQIVDSMTEEERGNALDAYKNTRERLDSEGMLEDRGYRYGSQWLSRSVDPEDVRAVLDILSRGDRFRR